MIDGTDVVVTLDHQDVLVGSARFIPGRRSEFVTRFQYSSEWLQHPLSFDLEPRLSRTSGTPATEGLPFSLDDSAPDAWGKRLIRAAARASGASAPGDPEFLLGVSDASRHGALRFRVNGEFQNPANEIPHLIDLPDLEAAATAVATGEDDHVALKLILGGTAGLGGARPKATVTDGGRLLIAKFTDAADEWDVIGWEKVTLDLAMAAGIPVPVSRLVPIGTRKALLLERFDRDDDAARIPYMSARTLLEVVDAASGDYEEIGEALAEIDIADISVARRGLWRRAAFSVAVHNTDDHLKNHGFLRTNRGWELSPAFDINPELTGGRERATGIAGARVPGAEPRGLERLARAFGITDAADVLDEVLVATERWAELARANGLTDADVTRFERVFAEPRPRLMELRDQLATAAKNRPQIRRGSGGKFS